MILCLHGLEIYTGPGGGLYNGATINHFSFNWPPINVLVEELEKRNMLYYANILKDHFKI